MQHHIPQAHCFFSFIAPRSVFGAPRCAPAGESPAGAHDARPRERTSFFRRPGDMARPFSRPEGSPSVSTCSEMLNRQAQTCCSHLQWQSPADHPSLFFARNIFRQIDVRKDGAKDDKIFRQHCWTTKTAIICQKFL